MYNKEVIEYAKEQENIISKLEYRVHEHDDGRSENRQDLMRDYARVLYSSSFRRLQGKMQLLGVDANKFNRNRLTHSLEVAQIARSIAYDRPNGMKGYILNLTVKGQGTVFQGKEAFEVKEGDLLLFPTGVPHFYHRSEQTEEWHHRWILL